jgi:hypothetical protein
MAKWDEFARTLWDTHPTARSIWSKAGSEGYHRFGTHRRYCAFDGPFDRFLYMDADTLLMGPVDRIFANLDNNNFVVYDFQFKDPSHVYNINSLKLLEVFSQERIKREIFCSGFYAAKKNTFDRETRNFIIEQLQQGDAEILYPMSVDQSALNYMVMKSERTINNLSLSLPKQEITGCCVTSPHFENRDNILYDKNKRLTYLHYIGLSSQVFARLCAGENLNIPYRDIFLAYRYRNNREELPKFVGKPKAYNPPPTFTQKLMQKIGLKK